MPVRFIDLHIVRLLLHQNRWNISSQVTGKVCSVAKGKRRFVRVLRIVTCFGDCTLQANGPTDVLKLTRDFEIHVTKCLIVVWYYYILYILYMALIFVDVLNRMPSNIKSAGAIVLRFSSGQVRSLKWLLCVRVCACVRISKYPLILNLQFRACIFLWPNRMNLIMW